MRVICRGVVSREQLIPLILIPIASILPLLLPPPSLSLFYSLHLVFDPPHPSSHSY